MINIMYHYIRPHDKEYPNFNYLDFDVFKRQLDFFEKKFGFLSKEEYIEAVKSKHNADGVVLSFDDGFIDHYQYAAQELKDRNLWGVFYIPTGALKKNTELLGVHRVHFLDGKYGASKILKESLNLIDINMLEDEMIKEFDKEIYQFSDYENNSKELRRLFNYYLKYGHRDEILDILMSQYFNETELHNHTYLNVDQIREMSNQGNLIGSHTENHKVLSRLTYEEQLYEIRSSFNYLSEICELEYKTFCYPYGYRSSYNNDTLKILEEEAIDEAVIFDNRHQDDIRDKYQLSRIDCNNFMDV